MGKLSECRKEQYGKRELKRGENRVRKKILEIMHREGVFFLKNVMRYGRLLFVTKKQTN